MGATRLVRTLDAHLRTWRPYTIWYPGLVGLAGATLAADPHADARLLAAWFVPTAIWTAAHYLGDYLDRDLDAISKPQRPIPSGRLRPGAALVCGAALAAAACAAALAVNWRTVLLLAIGIGGALAYNGLFKARGIWGNIVRGALTGAAFAFGTMMAVPLPPAELLPFVVVFWAHDAASNLVGTLRDVAGDREGGYATFAVRRGLRTAGRTAAALYGLAVATAAAGAALVPRDRAAYLLVVLLAALIGCGAFRVVLAPGRTLTQHAALRAHEVLVAERLVLADALLVPGLGLPAAIGILLPVLVLTITIQRAMRSGHEFVPEDRAQPAH
ncbi:UbiA family prenyltransferase [Kitasatospora sp. NPDC048239]|uniref:UbiA family prenyltransferase n=1 Tax=Kitasatospora sp. NPDC048239 TaxID=3364046 RepID=UPI0037236E4F